MQSANTGADLEQLKAERFDYTDVLVGNARRVYEHTCSNDRSSDEMRGRDHARVDRSVDYAGAKRRVRSFDRADQAVVLLATAHEQKALLGEVLERDLVLEVLDPDVVHVGAALRDLGACVAF